MLKNKDHTTEVDNILKPLLIELLKYCSYNKYSKEIYLKQLNLKNVWFIRSKIDNIDSFKSYILTFKNEAIVPYYKILKFLNKNFLMVSNTMYKQNIEVLLVEILSNKQDKQKIIDNWLKQLHELKKEQYKFYTLITNYPFDHKFTLDNVTISPIKSIEGQQMINECCTTPETKDDLEAKNVYPFNAICLSIVNAYNADHCRVIALTHIERAMSLIKLIKKDSGISLEAKRIFTRREYIVTENNSSFSMTNKFTGNITPNNYETIEKLKNHAERFFFKENKTKLEKSILSALYWYGCVNTILINNENTSGDKITEYISYMNGLERLILYDSTKNKGEMFAKRLSKIYKYYTEEDWREFYVTRNCLMHENEPNILEEDLFTLRGILSNLIINLICQSEKYNNLKPYFTEIYHL